MSRTRITIEGGLFAEVEGEVSEESPKELEGSTGMETTGEVRSGPEIGNNFQGDEVMDDVPTTEKTRPESMLKGDIETATLKNTDYEVMDAIPKTVPERETIGQKRRNLSEGTQEIGDRSDTSSLSKKLKETETDPSEEKVIASVDKIPETAEVGVEHVALVVHLPELVNVEVRAKIKKRVGTATATDDGRSIDSEQSVTSTVNRKNEKLLYQKLVVVISKAYINATERLKLDFLPRCVPDLEHCHQHHYKASPPPATNHKQANNLQCALQQQRYSSFINYTNDMCHRGEYPGEGTLTMIIELVLSINTKGFHNDFIDFYLNKSIELFSFIVRKFPPCWLTMRQKYINFVKTPLDPKKISTKYKQPFKSIFLFDILLELLENTLEQCSSTDLQTKNGNDVTTLEPKSPSTMDDNEKFNEYLKMLEWKVEDRPQTFEALETPGKRLERIYLSLQLLLQILENDLVMWILHHFKTPADSILIEEEQPLVVLIFTLSEHSRSTPNVKKLFKLFAVSTNKGASRSYLCILERLISLLMVVSNIADLEHSSIGVRYPNLGAKTKSLICEFFKTFKSHNTSDVSSYMNTIELLRIPYVRCEFIDNYLQLLQLPQSEPMSPKKIANDISKKRWVKYKTQAEMSDSHGADLTREQYLQLLLFGLEAYCDWHGTKDFFNILADNKQNGTSEERPSKSGGPLISIKKHIEDLDLERLHGPVDLYEKVRLIKQKIALPPVKICVDSALIEKYRIDLKHVMILNKLVNEKQAEPNDSVTEASDVDFTAWRTYLSGYAGDRRTEAGSSTNLEAISDKFILDLLDG